MIREEAWALYLAKLEEEANYFTVPDTEQVNSYSPRHRAGT